MCCIWKHKWICLFFLLILSAVFWYFYTRLNEKDVHETDTLIRDFHDLKSDSCSAAKDVKKMGNDLVKEGKKAKEIVSEDMKELKETVTGCFRNDG